MQSRPTVSRASSCQLAAFKGLKSLCTLEDLFLDVRHCFISAFLGFVLMEGILMIRSWSVIFKLDHVAVRM
jgi:hypothetical protein